MNINTTEAYEYYKQLYAPFIIFFRVGNKYEAYKEDSDTVSKTLGVPVMNERVSFPVTNFLDVVGKLAERGIQSKIITSRGDSGRYEILDVRQLKAEIELDK